MNNIFKKPQNGPVNKWVYSGVVLFLVALIVVLIYIGKSKSKYQGLNEEAVEALVPQLTQVVIEPAEAYSVDSIRAMAVLKKPVNHITYQYQWYVNGESIPQVDMNILESKYFRKGDKIHCEVVAKAGQYESDKVASPAIQIKNSKPVIQLKGVESFKVPGLFQYQINATDPDGDALVYRLVAPLDRGITVNSVSGLLEWNIPAFTPSAENEGNVVGENVCITFEAKDPDGESVTASITLNLSIGSEMRI